MRSKARLGNVITNKVECPRVYPKIIVTEQKCPYIEGEHS